MYHTIYSSLKLWWQKLLWKNNVMIHLPCTIDVLVLIYKFMPFLRLVHVRYKYLQLSLISKNMLSVRLTYKHLHWSTKIKICLSHAGDCTNWISRVEGFIIFRTVRETGSVGLNPNISNFDLAELPNVDFWIFFWVQINSH